MDYRKANINDVLYLTQLRQQQLLAEGQLPLNDISKELSLYFTASLLDEALISWLAIDRGTVAATGAVCFYQLPPTFSNPTGRVAYITNMYVLPDYRNRGIASHLLNRVIDEAKSRGYQVLRLHASSDGRPLYEKRGFVDSENFMEMIL